MAQPEEDVILPDHLSPDERDPEVSDADAVEQATVANPAAEGPEEVHRGLEVADWDAVEQARVVSFDEEYER
jgi:hypothetical protein